MLCPKNSQPVFSGILFSFFWHQPIIRVTPVIGESKKYLPSPNTFYLPLPIEIPEINIQKKIDSDPPVRIMSVGKFQKRKNHFLLIDALKAVNKKHAVELTIIGVANNKLQEKYLAKLKHRVASINEFKITIKVALPFRKMENEYLNNDLFILPARNEHYGISLLEAMSYGLAVICSDSNGSKEVVRNGVNGFIFKTDDLSDLTKKIETIIEDKKNIIRMGEKSHEIARTECSFDAYYKRLRQIAETNFPAIHSKLNQTKSCHKSNFSI